MWSSYTCLFIRRRKWGPLSRKKKIIDHHGMENGLSPISRLAREACEKDTQYLPLVPQHAQIKSSLKGRENIMSIAFSSATWKGNSDPVLDQFKLCPFGRLLLGPGNCKSEEWKIKENEKKNHVLCQYLLFLWSSVCCLLSWDYLQRVHGIFKKQSEKAGSTFLLQSADILTLQTIIMGFPGAWCYIICHDAFCECPWTSCLTLLSLFLCHFSGSRCHQGGIWWWWFSIFTKRDFL